MKKILIPFFSIFTFQAVLSAQWKMQANFETHALWLFEAVEGEKILSRDRGDDYWLSEDAGKSWINVTEGGGLPELFFIFSAFFKDGQLYVHSSAGIMTYEAGWRFLHKGLPVISNWGAIRFLNEGEKFYFFIGGNKPEVYVSEDKGENWKFLTGTADLPIGWQPTTLIAAGSELYLRVASGVDYLLRRFNASKNTWDSTPLSNIIFENGLQPDFTVLKQGQLVFISEGTTYYRFSDGTHKKISGLPSTGRGLRSLATLNGRLIALTMTQNDEVSAFVSEDQGLDWKPLNTLPKGAVKSDLAAWGDQLYLIINGEVFNTTDAINWNKFEAGLPQLFSAKKLYATGDRLYVLGIGGDAPFYTLSKGQNSWQPVEMFFWDRYNIFFWDGSISQGLWVFEAGGITIYTKDEGLSWKPAHDLSLNDFQKIGSTLYAVSNNDIFGTPSGEFPCQLFKSSDEGVSWQYVRTMPNTGRLFSHEGKLYFSGLYGYIAESGDGGTTWKALNKGLDPKGYHRLLVFSEKVWYTVYNGFLIYKSENKGESWTRLDDSPIVSLNSIRDLISFNGLLLALGDGPNNQPGCYYTADGKIWKKAESLKGHYERFAKAGNKLLVFSSIDGCFTTEDGTAWQDFSEGFPKGFGHYIAKVIPFGNNLYALGGRPSLWRRALAPVAAREPLGLNFRLFPNPAADKLILEFGDEQPEDYCLLLHDAAGRLVRRADVSKTAASRQVLELGDLPAGIYTVTMQCKTGTVSQKIVKN